ncbi:MAG: hypothetical protein Tsb0020_30050 [Haliangiales bacterium]
MAGGDFFDDLDKKSNVQKLGMLLLPILLGGLVYWQLVYVDMSDGTTTLESRQQTLISDRTSLDRDIEDQKRLLQRMEELEQSIRANQRALPTEPELSGFFDFLQRRAGEAGINIRKWEQKPPETVDIYVRVPVEIEIGGDFLSIVRYFYLLGPRTVSPSSDSEVTITGDRIVSIEDLFLGDAKQEDGTTRLVGRFVASTFHLDAAAAAARTPGQPSGAAGAQPGRQGGAR